MISTVTFPLNLLVFTSTAGHFGYHDVYQTSINHLEKSLGSLDVFAGKFAHIKVRPHAEERARLPEMQKFFESKEIVPIVTEADWQRGMSHQNEYLKDIHRMAESAGLHRAPFTFWFEDDSPINCKTHNLGWFLDNAICALDDFSLLNVRFIREGVTQEMLPLPDEMVRVQTFDFQPNISRTRDLYVASRIIHHNWEQFKNIQCEMAFRLAMSFLSDSPNRFLGFNPEAATSYHIGTPEYPKFLEEYSSDHDFGK